MVYSLQEERLFQEENKFQDLEAVVDRLTKSRNKAESSKMVVNGFATARMADLTFFSVFTLPMDKLSSQQTQLRNFFCCHLKPRLFLWFGPGRNRGRECGRKRFHRAF